MSAQMCNHVLKSCVFVQGKAVNLTNAYKFFKQRENQQQS